MDPLVCLRGHQNMCLGFCTHVDKRLWHASSTSSPPRRLTFSSSPGRPKVKRERLPSKCWAPAGVLRPTPPCGHFPHSGLGHALCTTLPEAQMDPLGETHVRWRSYKCSNEHTKSTTKPFRVYRSTVRDKMREQTRTAFVSKQHQANTRHPIWTIKNT